MLRILSTLSFLAGAHAAFGPAFSTGPTATDVYITHAISTLVLPDFPTNEVGDLSLWCGMGTSNGDLIQSIAQAPGPVDGTTWSVFAYTLSEQFGVEKATPVDTSNGVSVTMNYTYDAATGNYTQLVSLNNVLVSELSTADDFALGWGTAVECAADDCGTVPAHKWLDTSITMSAADPTYIDTNGMSAGVTGDLVTADGGLTWTVAEISIPEFTF